ncbi:cellulose biosynthesis cyclic di-GMP-binding regulatory protein BcsB [Ammoniphilus sp. 3BR4]|uniref:cellulose biosynthesis cyclic di-GMP-binding regulatory protein BcsB n=1 Tax=Ammoniphilus sp. 3BR4 TaxID=3158265 RepID=UPI0034668666
MVPRLILFFLLFQLIALPVQASPLLPQNAENLFIFSEDRVITGVSNQQDYYFQVGQSRKVMPESYIDLFFSHSSTLLPDRSTITVLVDDVPLSSQYLDQTNMSKTHWRLDLSHLGFKPGFHKLSIKSRMEVSGNLCQDQNNEANWMIIHKESHVHLKLSQMFEKADLAWYPSPFFEKASTQPLQTLFVLPDHPTEKEIQALARITQYFSQQAAGANQMFSAFRESDVEMDALGNSHIVMLGERGSWKEIGKIAGVQDGISLIESPWNSAKFILYVTGSPQVIENASILLSDTDLIPQLSGHYLDVPEQLEKKNATHPDNLKNRLSIGSLGYGDLVIESVSVGSAMINYTLPQEVEVTQNGKLTLEYRHSKTLNFAQSLMVVHVNDVPVASQYLTEESSEAGVMNVTIPKEMLQAGFVNVEVAFQFTSSTEACTGNTQIGNWAVVSKDSFFSIDHQYKQAADLKSLPYPFMNQNGWKDTVFVLPSQPQSEELSLFYNVLGVYGRNSFANDPIQVVLGESNQQEVSNHHAVYVGLTHRLPLKEGLDSQLPIRFHGSKIKADHPDVQLLESLEDQVGIVALAPSDNDQYRVFIAGTDQPSLKRLQEAFIDRNVYQKFQGQLVLIDRSRNVHAFLTQPAEPPTTKLDELKEWASHERSEMSTRLGFIAVFLIILAATSFLLWKTRRKG